jgi:hypothetical protein
MSTKDHCCCRSERNRNRGGRLQRRLRRRSGVQRAICRAGFQFADDHEVGDGIEAVLVIVSDGSEGRTARDMEGRCRPSCERVSGVPTNRPLARQSFGRCFATCPARAKRD